MAKHIPVRQHYDRMPVDISFVFEDEKPAGKHGFCKVEGDHFAFEDGTRARFFGVMCNSGAMFPEHDYAEKVARRLGQSGINYVRFHQLDAEWATPNIYRVTAGKTVYNTREFSPESMDRLDYWIKCLKDQGIYASMDMTTYRKFKTGDGVKFADQMMDNMKLYAKFDPVMIDLQKEFCTNFWNHYNPYTGLCYKDDPFFFCCIITNENDTFRNHNNRWDHNIIPYYEEEFLDMFKAWLKEEKIDYDWDNFQLFNTDDNIQYKFRTELERKYALEMYNHLRSIGVKIPLSDTNYSVCDGLIDAQKEMDYRDGHCYFYNWTWGEFEKNIESRHLFDQPDSILGPMAANRIAGTPQILSEWDMPWPNPYRAEGLPWYAAMVCLQDWSAMSIHTYAYSNFLSDDMTLGKEICGNTIGNVPYREGIFAIWNDPAKFGLFYHGALMMRRGDVKPAEKLVCYKLNPNELGKPHFTMARTAMEIHRVAALTEGMDESIADEIVDGNEKYPREKAKLIVSDTGEITRNIATKRFYVDTPRTKIVSGSLCNATKTIATVKNKPLLHQLNGLTIDADSDFGTIAMSSLTDDAIENSGNILLTAVGRAGNTGVVYDGDKIVDRGHLPIQIEVIEADISIKTSKPNLRVWAIDSDGFFTGRLPTTYEDGIFKFHIGDTCPSQYYLIMEE